MEGVVSKLMYRILKILFPSLVWKYSSSEKSIYITFDDGPFAELTPFILKELKKYNAKATFFLTGEQVEKDYSLYKKILQDGHSVGNHGYSHLNGWKTENKTYFYDIEKCHNILNTTLFRPPYGKIKPSQISHLKKQYNIIMWDVLSWDFNSKLSPQKCLQKVIRDTKNGSIIVFHDNQKSMKNLMFVLPKFLNYFHSKGFKFKRI